MNNAASAKNVARLYNASLSRREVHLLAEWERERRPFVTLNDIRRAVGVGAAEDVVWRLRQKRVLVRVGHGKYLLRPVRTLTRPTEPSGAIPVAALLQGERYYLGGLWALTFHRLTAQQFASTLDAFVTRRHQSKNIGAVKVVFHRVPRVRLDVGITTASIEGVTVSVSDPERTVLDLLDNSSLAGTGDEALRLFQEALPKVSAARLVEYAATGSKSSTCQRLGVLLERAGASTRQLAALQARVRATRSMLSMRPGYPRRGTFNRRWKVVENDS